MSTKGEITRRQGERLAVRSCLAAFLTGAAHSSEHGSKPSSLTIGAVLKLTKECPSMPTRKGWDEFRSALSSGDHMAAAKLILEQSGRFVPGVTKINIKDFGFFDAVGATDQTADVHMGEHLFFARACVGE